MRACAPRGSHAHVARRRRAPALPRPPPTSRQPSRPCPAWAPPTRGTCTPPPRCAASSATRGTGASASSSSWTRPGTASRRGARAARRTCSQRAGRAGAWARCEPTGTRRTSRSSCERCRSSGASLSLSLSCFRQLSSAFVSFHHTHRRPAHNTVSSRVAHHVKLGLPAVTTPLH